ncbi:MAG TPA: PEP-CTERM sorting domain-containing protein [Desulfomonilia bacterium]|nr:PEP-CTERM sorting domain-containing protein [Desulfomonilia bacterium]
MKKLAVACMGMMVVLLGVSGVGHALLFTDTRNLDVTLRGIGTYTWSQANPRDFQVQAGAIMSALTIDASLVDVWGRFLQRYRQGQIFSGALIFRNGLGNPMDMTLRYNEGGWLGSNFLNSDISTFKRDHVPAPIPEPATYLLIGSGLIGLSRIRRRGAWVKQRKDRDS